MGVASRRPDMRMRPSAYKRVDDFAAGHERELTLVPEQVHIEQGTRSVTFEVAE